jgi:hypothetical protein
MDQSVAETVEAKTAQIGSLIDALPKQYRDGERSSVRRSLYGYFSMDPDKADTERSVATEGSIEATIQKEIDRLGKEMIPTVERVFWNLDDDSDKDEVSSERARAKVKETLYDCCGSERGDKPQWNKSRNAKQPEKYIKSMQSASDFLEDVRTGKPRGSTENSRTRSQSLARRSASFGPRSVAEKKKRLAMKAAKKAKLSQKTARTRSSQTNSEPATDFFEQFCSNDNTTLTRNDDTINISRQEFREFQAWKDARSKRSRSGRSNPSTHRSMDRAESTGRLPRSSETRLNSGGRGSANDPKRAGSGPYATYYESPDDGSSDGQSI